jgi:hypothetical protein
MEIINVTLTYSYTSQQIYHNLTGNKVKVLIKCPDDRIKIRLTDYGPHFTLAPMEKQLISLQDGESLYAESSEHADIEMVVTEIKTIANTTIGRKLHPKAGINEDGELVV